MKIKHDFVTNSSSASFIIADLKGNKEKIFYKITDKIKVNLLEVLPYVKMDDQNQIREWYRYEDEEEVLEFINIFRRGGIIYNLFAYDEADDIIQAGFCNVGILQENITTKNIKVIKGEGGY